jgi:hypothetical protein
VSTAGSGETITAKSKTELTLRPLCLAAGTGLALALVWSGCGGDTRRGETETTSPEANSPTTFVPARHGTATTPPVATIADPRRQAYVARTDRICRSLDSERNTERQRAREAADLQGATKAYEQGTALGGEELKRLEAVAPPPGDAAVLRANVFDPVRRQLALRAQIRVALAAVDLPRLRVLRARLDDISRALSAFARGYGWRACGGSE